MTTSQQNPYAPPQAEVQDTVDAETYEAASRGIRLGAAILDGIIAMVFFIPFFFVVGMNSSAGGNPMALAENPLLMFSAGAGIALALGFCAWAGINWYLVHKNGQTIAKKICGIKVVRSDGSRASVARIFWLRNIVNGIPGVIPLIGSFYPLVDSLFIFNDRRQCLHDKIADTVVVRA